MCVSATHLQIFLERKALKECEISNALAEASGHDCAECVRLGAVSVALSLGRTWGLTGEIGWRHLSQMAWIKKRPTTSMTAQVAP
jgi:hypothetical protein